MHRPLAYRPEIDGLRAFAVISVLIYHLNPSWLPGGYLGVDIFFVISGFLITSIIVKDCAAGEFSFKEFYLRRARRILPAMLTVTALTCAAAYFILFPDELKAAAKACKNALLCYSNYHFAREGGYFEPSAEANPFLHTWSLGVEEQFYFLFPLVAVLAYGRGWLKARYLGGFVLVGLAVSCFMTFQYPVRAFFALESRAWELGAGAWLAVAVARGTLPGWLSHRAVAATSLVLLLLSVVLLRNGDLVPAPLAALAVLGAVLFIGGRAGGSGSRLHGIFASVPLRFLGRISYSLYLVHWPLIVFVRSWRGELTPAIAAGLAVASVLLAVALHHAVEQPLRHRRKPLFFLTGLAATSGVLLWCAEFVNEKKGQVNPSTRAALSEILPEWGEPQNNRESPYLIGQTDVEPSVGLWGDSHAMALIPALEAELKQRGLCCEVWARSGNLAAVDVKLRGKESHINGTAVVALSRPSIRHVIISSRWTSYLKGKSEEHQPEPRIARAATPKAALEILREGMENAFKRLQGPGREIVLVYPVPEAGIHVPYYMARKRQAGQDICDLGLEAPGKDYPARHDLTIPMFDKMCAKYSLLPVYPDKLLILDGVLQISRGNLALYSDDDHLSRFGTTPLVKEIMARFTWPQPGRR
jgi:peptidoglycan/LPS O-acetylase OafA/YrhL